jgi:O-antigen/teichoic acid export membrane protein
MHGKAARRYMAEFTVAMVLYVVLLLPSVWWIRANPESAVRWVVALIPLLPGVGVGWAVLRFFQRMDELQRRQLTETLAFAFVSSALLVLTVGFLQMAGLPHVSVWWIWLGMGASWIIGSGLTAQRYR